MDDEIHSLMRWDTWGIISRASFYDHNVLPGQWYFKCKIKPDWNTRKFKELYFVRVDVQRRLYPKPLKVYSPVIQWSKVSLMLIFKSILGFQGQSIDLKNAFSQEYIPSEEPVFIGLPKYLKSDGVQCDVFLIWMKILYGQSEEILTCLKPHQEKIEAMVTPC